MNNADWSDLADEIAMYTRPRHVSWVERLMRVVAGITGRLRRKSNGFFLPDESEDGGAPVLVASPRGPSPLRHGAAAQPPKPKAKLLRPHAPRRIT
jgi:hypothetical protein